MKSCFPKEVKGYNLSTLSNKPIAAFAKLCNRAACEGSVLLRNENSTLPVKQGTKISVFGRMQERYLGSGSGSGGGVRPLYKTDILSSIRKSPDVSLNEELASLYADWSSKNPIDEGGWTKPHSQKEMPLTDECVKHASETSDFALIIISRMAGEDSDCERAKGSYYLREDEEDMMRTVAENFARVCVYLNVGSVMDMSWVDKYKPGAVLIGWQGGQEGGDAAVKIITGKVCPSGKLADSIIYNLSAYPADNGFGNKEKVIYTEDIYVGYRYYETFDKENVQYPFGFGLSYTTFDISFIDALRKKDSVTFTFKVKNTGTVTGKEVVQVYLCAPQGKLGKPSRTLVGFAKTKNIPPMRSYTVNVTVPMSYLSSYDDSGITGNKSCYVTESGKYSFFVGNNVRDAEKFFDLSVKDDTVTERCEEAAAPVEQFERIKAASLNGETVQTKETVPTRTYDIEKRIEERLPKEIPYTGDRGLKLIDVYEKRCTMDEFVAQLSDDDLCCLCRGEGMRSIKVKTDTASIFGGVTPSLLSFGIPIGTTNDGPCGIRDLACGTRTTAMPSGTCIACTWDVAIAEELMVYEGLELHTHLLDSLLGPGINIHRHPLGGRNFEYFSEDPLLTGKMAAAMSRGVHVSGKSATIKHMAANSQETNRHGANSVMSERALREIYLRAFEIAVKEGGVDSIMTSYNPVNGIWCASNYDINTAIVRGEWKYDGIIMTDWWASSNGKEGVPGSRTDLADMVKSQNDVYMVVSNAENNKDNLEESLESGKLTRGELQRSAKNILRFLMHTTSFEGFVNNGYTDPFELFKNAKELKSILRIQDLESDKFYDLPKHTTDYYLIRVEYTCEYPMLEQHDMWIKFSNDYAKKHLVSNPGDGKSALIEDVVFLSSANTHVSAYVEEKIHVKSVEIFKAVN
ncbi:MAG: glycoside hydrolase family 3 C-terminal domain-containing protein [Eubacteriales bacterium]|nr:glycoside hydrolase family 3 C-terminal domain-containing protein [Eubacteriales bacterium]